MRTEFKLTVESLYDQSPNSSVIQGFSWHKKPRDTQLSLSDGTFLHQHSSLFNAIKTPGLITSEYLKINVIDFFVFQLCLLRAYSFSSTYMHWLNNAVSLTVPKTSLRYIYALYQLGEKKKNSKPSCEIVHVNIGII